MTLSRGGYELNEIWHRQIQALSESEEDPKAREARVLAHHEKGNHFDVVRSLIDHHSTMSDKERKAYDGSIRAWPPTVPR